MQNDRLNLMVILAEKNCNIMLCRKRYLQNKLRKMVKEVQRVKERIDSNDTLECDNKAHKAVLSAHSHFF